MAKGFEKGALIVLCLLVLVTAMFVFTTEQHLKHDNKIIAEVDSRTEHLRDRVIELEKRLKKVEIKK